MNAPLAWLQVATAATSLGKWAFAMALGVYAFEQGGTTAVGFVALIQAIPSALAAPLLGMLGDEYPRQRVLLSTNFMRAVLLALVAASMFYSLPLAVTFGLAVLFSVVSTANQPARAALIPVLARTPGEVSSATAFMGVVDTASFLIGAGFGGVLLAVTSSPFVISCCAGAYALAAALLLLVPRDERPAVKVRQHPLKELVAGFRAAIDDYHLRLAISVLAALSVVDGLTNVLVIVTSIELLNTGTAGIGYLNIAYGVGGLLGGTAALALMRRSRLTVTLAAGSLALCLPLIVLGIVPSEVTGLAAWAAAGLGFVAMKVSGLTLVQRLSGDRVLARVLAVVEATFVASIGIGAILAPLLVSAVGIDGALIITGCVLPLAVLTRWRSLRRLEIGAPVPERQYELLRHCPVFAPLPLASTENLARRLHPLEVEAGAEVITQGDTGDQFYVIDSGLVEVFQDGEWRRHQGPGESFGEIALLHRSLRTATVRAVEPTKLYSLDREPFLVSVLGYADSEAAAHEVSERFLAPV